VEGEEEGKIAQEIAAGYKRGKKLLKPAQVKVFKKSNN
jgi:molecular chaperone GrpE (heat shock protein)